MQGAKVQHLCKMKWDAAQHATTITTDTDQIRISTGNFGVLDAAINATSIRKSCAHMQVAFIAASCTSHNKFAFQFKHCYATIVLYTVIALLGHCYWMKTQFHDLQSYYSSYQPECLYSMYLQYAWSHLLYYQSLIWYVMYLCILLSIVLGPWASTVLSRGANPPNATYSHIVPE